MKKINRIFSSVWRQLCFFHEPSDSKDKKSFVFFGVVVYGELWLFYIFLNLCGS